LIISCFFSIGLIFLFLINKHNHSGSGKIFLKKPERSTGLHPRHFGSCKCDTSRTGNTSSSLLIAGAARGDWTVPSSSYKSFSISYPDKRSSPEPTFSRCMEGQESAGTVITINPDTYWYYLCTQHA
jgi:hypothetical protein